MYHPQLDAFRFFLFALILISHSYIDAEVVYQHDWITSLYRVGWVGVQGFFCSVWVYHHLYFSEGICEA